MTPKQRRRAGILSRAHSLYTMSHDTACVHCCFCPIIQVSWRIIRISHARTRARTIVASVTPLPLPLPLSSPLLPAFLSFSLCPYERTCVFGSAGRDGWARRSFGQGVVHGLPRDLRREIDALWEAIVAQPMHRQWRSHLATSISSSRRSFPNSAYPRVLRRYSRHPPRVDRTPTNYAFIREFKNSERTVLFSSIYHRRIPASINTASKFTN